MLSQARSYLSPMSETSSDERDDWVRLSLQCLARAYGDDEPEYSRDQIKEANPEYGMNEVLHG